MKTIPVKNFVSLAMAASMFVFCSCEEDEGYYIDYETPFISIQGGWSGSDTCGCRYSALDLHDSNGTISGAVLYPDGGWRDLSGIRAGSRMSIWVDGGNEWILYYDDDRLYGTGHNPYEDYDICFRRR